MPAPTPRPRSVFRRLERRMMGGVMAVGAFLIEKIVMRSIRKGGGKTKDVEGTLIPTKGGEIEGSAFGPEA